MKLVGAFFYVILSWLLAHSPRFFFYGLADFVYFILYRVLKYRRKVVLENLKKSFPEKSEKEIKEIATKFYHHLADIFIENIAIIRMSKKRFLKMVSFKNLDIFEDLYKKNKSVVGIIAHYANWEVLTGLAPFTDYQILSVYKPLTNKFFDREFYNMRKRFGEVPVSMHDTFRTVLKYHREKKLSILGLIADQRPPKGSGNYWTHFLNQETAVFLGPEKIAKKFNSAVVYSHVDKIKRGKYVVELELLFENPSECKEFEITESHVRILENKIRQKPELWLWSHKRWKHKRDPESPIH